MRCVGSALYLVYLRRTSAPADATAPGGGSGAVAEDAPRASCTRKPAECRDRTACRRVGPRTSGTRRATARGCERWVLSGRSSSTDRDVSASASIEGSVLERVA